MNDLYKEFRKRCIDLKINREIIEIFYFSEYAKNFTNEEMFLILRYPDSRFKSYVNFIENLAKQKKLFDNAYKVKELTKIIFNNQSDNCNILKELILKTDIIFNSDVLEFAHSFVNINNRNKANTIRDLIIDNKDIINKNLLMKVVTYINTAKTDEQIKALCDLFLIPNIAKRKDFINFVQLILNNPNSKFLSYIPNALKKYGVYNYVNAYELVSYFIKINDSKVADLVLKIITNNNMFKSGNTLKNTINYVLNKKNRNKLSYVDLLVSKKSNMSDMRFMDILYLYDKCDKSFKLDCINELVNCGIALTYDINDDSLLNKRGLLSSFQFTLITKYILESKTEYQAKEIISLILDTNFPLNYLENYKIISYLDTVIKTENKFQVKLMTELIKTVAKNIYLYDKYLDDTNYNVRFPNTRLEDALNAILRLKENDLGNRLLDILTLKNVLEYDKSDAIINKFLGLKNVNQANVFYEIVKKPTFLTYNNLSVLDYIKLADNYQLQLIEKIIMKTIIYHDSKKLELLRSLLVSNNRFILNYITAILLKISEIGYENANTMIRQVLENPNPNLLKNIMKNNFDERLHGINVIYQYEELNKEGIRMVDKVGKVLSKKKTNNTTKNM